jgi:CubicO group peptidase (beta-lactamase class C family)
MGSALRSFAEELPGLLTALLAEHRCPGAVAGIVLGDETLVVPAGIADLATGVPVTEQTVFQIGSNTKLYTATLAMQAVDEGRLSLGDRVVAHLPGFRLADGAARDITIRHLLTHTSGIDGDFTGPPGHDFSDDMLERFVESMAELSLLHRPGENFSYCNAGWVLLGRVLEVVHGKPFHALLREHLAQPLGATHTGMLPAEIAQWDAAFGHLPDPVTGDSVRAPAYATSPGSAPAGSVPVATAADVLAFLRMHLAGGVAASGRRVLSERSCAQMTQRQLDVPPSGTTDGWGLGWMLGHTVEGHRVISHGGGTLGQLSHLQVLPDLPLALVILTNGLGGGMLGLSLIETVFERLAGASVPKPPVPADPQPDLDLSRYEGHYERTGVSVDVAVVGGALQATVVQDSPVPEVDLLPPFTVGLRAVDRELWVLEGPGGGVIRFLEFDSEGRPAYAFNSRLIPRRVSAA